MASLMRANTVPDRSQTRETAEVVERPALSCSRATFNKKAAGDLVYSFKWLKSFQLSCLPPVYAEPCLYDRKQLASARR